MSVSLTQLFRLRSSLLARAVVSCVLAVSVLTPIAVPFVAHAEPNTPATYGGLDKPTEPKSILAGCDLSAGSLLTGGTAFSTCFAGIIYFFFVYITGFVAGIAGFFFDFTTVISLTGPTYANPFINSAWTLSRDLANMAFVFLLIYLAFTLILDIAHSGVGKQLAKIIAVALLINFSFFFSRVVIDASNILSHTFYDKINGQKIGETRGVSSASSPVMEVKSLSANILSGVNVQRLLDDGGREGTFSQFQKSIEKQNGWINFALLASVFILFGVMNIILIFIFVTAGIQMIGRVVRLWLVIMLAPIGFIAWIIPGLGSVATRWWKTLLNAALFAPAFLLGLYIIILLIQGGVLNGLSPTGAPLASNGDDLTLTNVATIMVLIFIRLGIIIGLLFGALKLGDYFGQTGSSAAIAGFKKYGGMAGKYSGAGMGLSYTVGAGAKVLDKKLAGTRLGNSYLGFRARQYMVKPVTKAKFFGAESAEDRTKRLKEWKKETTGNLRDISNGEMLTRAAFEEDLKTPRSKASFDLLDDETKTRAKEIVQNATTRELESIGIKMLTSLAHLQNEATVKRIDGMDVFTEEQRATNRSAWTRRRSAYGELGASDAPINKADSIVSTIRDLYDATAVLRQNTPQITSLFSQDTLIDKNKLELAGREASVALENAKRAVKAANTSGIQADIVTAVTERANAEKLIQEIKKLEDERKTIAPKIGKHATGTLVGGAAAAETKQGELYSRDLPGAGGGPAGGGGNNPPPNNPPNNPPGGGGGAGGPAGGGAGPGGAGGAGGQPFLRPDMGGPRPPRTGSGSRSGIRPDGSPESGGTPPRGGGGQRGETGVGEGTASVLTTDLNAAVNAPSSPEGGPGSASLGSMRLASDVIQPGEVLRGYNSPLREGVGVNEPEKAILRDEYEKMRQGLQNPDTMVPFDLLPPDQISKLKQMKDNYENLGRSLGEAVNRDPEFANKLGRHQDRIRKFESQIKELDRNQSELEAAGQDLPELRKQRKTLEEEQVREFESYMRTLEEGIGPAGARSQTEPSTGASQTRMTSAESGGSTPNVQLASGTIPMRSSVQFAAPADRSLQNANDNLTPSPAAPQPQRLTRVEQERARIQANAPVQARPSAPVVPPEPQRSAAPSSPSASALPRQSFPTSTLPSVAPPAPQTPNTPAQPTAGATRTALAAAAGAAAGAVAASAAATSQNRAAADAARRIQAGLKDQARLLAQQQTAINKQAQIQKKDAAARLEASERLARETQRVTQAGERMGEVIDMASRDRRSLSNQPTAQIVQPARREVGRPPAISGGPARVGPVTIPTNIGRPAGTPPPRMRPPQAPRPANDNTKGTQGTDQNKAA